MSRSFCDLTTSTRLLAYMKYPGNMQLNRLKGLRINSPPSAISKATVTSAGSIPTHGICVFSFKGAGDLAARDQKCHPDISTIKRVLGGRKILPCDLIRPWLDQHSCMRSLGPLLCHEFAKRNPP